MKSIIGAALTNFSKRASSGRLSSSSPCGPSCVGAAAAAGAAAGAVTVCCGGIAGAVLLFEVAEEPERSLTVVSRRFGSEPPH